MWRQFEGDTSGSGVKAITAALELELVLIEVLGVVNVVTPDSAVLCGKSEGNTV